MVMMMMMTERQQGKNSLSLCPLFSKIQEWLALPLLQSKKMFSLFFTPSARCEPAASCTSALLFSLSLLLSPTTQSSSYRFLIPICQDFFFFILALSPSLSPTLLPLFYPPIFSPSLETCCPLVRNWGRGQRTELWVGRDSPYTDTTSCQSCVVSADMGMEICWWKQPKTT